MKSATDFPPSLACWPASFPGEIQTLRELQVTDLQKLLWELSFNLLQMSLIPSHSTLVTAFTLLPSPLSFFLFFLLTLPTCEINHKLHPAVRMSRSKKLAAPWARKGAGIAAPISVSWRRSLGLVLPRCAPLSTLDPHPGTVSLCFATGLGWVCNFSETSHLACRSRAVPH